MFWRITDNIIIQEGVAYSFYEIKQTKLELIKFYYIIILFDLNKLIMDTLHKDCNAGCVVYLNYLVGQFREQLSTNYVT